jgi:hypothetical protein
VYPNKSVQPTFRRYAALGFSFCFCLSDFANELSRIPPFVEKGVYPSQEIWIVLPLTDHPEGGTIGSANVTDLGFDDIIIANEQVLELIIENSRTEFMCI